MRQKNLMVQLFGVAFLCFSIALTGSATRKQELERAAELAVERAAERVAERAVEKALETGNSSSETETIRVSHSSVRKYDSTKQLPGFVYTPATRREHERIVKEKEAGELAVAQIMRGRVFRRAVIDDNYKFRNPRVEQDNDNIFSHGGHFQSHNTDVDHHETPIKSWMHPVEVKEVTPLFIFNPHGKFPIDHMSHSEEKDKETHQTEIGEKSVSYHPMKLFEISQAIPMVHYYHRPPLTQSIQPIYYYQGVKTSKNNKNTNDEAST